MNNGLRIPLPGRVSTGGGQAAPLEGFVSVPADRNCATSDQVVRYHRGASWEDSFPIWFYGRAGAARAGQRPLSNRSWRAHQTNEGNAFERSARGNEKPPPQRLPLVVGSSSRASSAAAAPVRACH